MAPIQLFLQKDTPSVFGARKRRWLLWSCVRNWPFKTNRKFLVWRKETVSSKQNLLEPGDLNEPAHIVGVHTVVDGPLGEFVPLVVVAPVDGQTELSVLVFAFVQVVHYLLCEKYFQKMFWLKRFLFIFQKMFWQRKKLFTISSLCNSRENPFGPCSTVFLMHSHCLASSTQTSQYWTHVLFHFSETKLVSCFWNASFLTLMRSAKYVPPK